MGKFPGGTAQKWAARQCNTSHIVKWNLHTSRIESIVNIVGATWIYLIYYLIIWYIDTCLPVMLRLAFCTLASLSWKISTNIAIHVQSESQDHAAGGHTKALKSTCQAGKSHATMPNEFGKKKTKTEPGRQSMEPYAIVRTKPETKTTWPLCVITLALVRKKCSGKSYELKMMYKKLAHVAPSQTRSRQRRWSLRGWSPSVVLRHIWSWWRANSQRIAPCKAWASSPMRRESLEVGWKQNTSIKFKSKNIESQWFKHGAKICFVSPSLDLFGMISSPFPVCSKMHETKGDENCHRHRTKRQQ